VPTYLAVVNFTEQGMKAIKDTRKRAEAFRALARKKGVKVKDLYWALGAFDGLLVLEAPDDGAVAALLIELGSQGNVRTQTARAFTAAEIEGLLPAE
jgi:uncharacterized protein with GYD domain